jgi:hypothetical protein
MTLPPNSNPPNHIESNHTNYYTSIPPLIPPCTTTCTPHLTPLVSLSPLSPTHPSLHSPSPYFLPPTPLIYHSMTTTIEFVAVIMVVVVIMIQSIIILITTIIAIVVEYFIEWSLLGSSFIHPKLMASPP